MKQEQEFDRKIRFAPGIVEAYAARQMRRERRLDWLRALALVLLAAAIGLLFIQPSNAAPAFGPYVAANVRAIDGDTFAAMFEVFPGVWLQRSVRVLGADTPEKASPQACERKLAQTAATFTASYLALAVQNKQPIQLWHVADDKYGGRVDATATVQSVDFAQILIKAGQGRPYAGGKRQPWCADATGPPVNKPTTEVQPNDTT